MNFNILEDNIYFLNLDSLKWTRYQVKGIGRKWCTVSLVPKETKEKPEKYTTQVYFIGGFNNIGVCCDI